MDLKLNSDLTLGNADNRNGNWTTKMGLGV